MKMIIGGAFQGKSAYARNTYSDITWIDGENCELQEIFNCQGILHFHIYIKRMLEAGEDVTEFPDKLISKNPDIIIVTDEIGYGVVPMEKDLRIYREQTGRICTKLAAFADQVTRIVCGIPVVIK